MTVSSRPLRHTLMIGASLISLSLAGTVQGQGISRVYTPNAVTQATQNAATQNAAAQAAAARTRAALEKAVQARQDIAAAQAIARAAAQAAESSIKNGLGGNGLRVADGIAADSSLWVGADKPQESVGEDGRTKVTIGQTQEKAILTWDSFNVGKTTDLTFDQATADYIVLNRVRGTDRSHIEGSITAKGSVYIINQNGILFGGASTVNVRNLIASSLDIHADDITARNQRFFDGLLPGTAAGASSTPTFSDGTGIGLPDEVFAEGDGVTVEAGAQIEVASYGHAVLLGHNVVNRGSLSAPDGQVVLGAGRLIYLENGLGRVAQYSGMPSERIRGFAVMNDGGGHAENTGLIVSERGNITLNGQTIFQNGVLAATTAIDANGSIVLVAGTERPNVGEVQIGTSRYKGMVVFGSDSHVSILPDGDGRTEPGNPYKASHIEVYGSQILFEDNATLYAPGAQLFLLAQSSNYTNNNPDPVYRRIYIGEGATIDVSGLNGVEIDMEQNSIRAEFRANELADNPVLRDSVLRGETVYFDGRLGENLDADGVANFQGWYDLIQRGVEQFMTMGGSITMSGAEIIAREGSVIDLSGGSVFYNDGYVQRTRLIDPYGRLVPIEEAIAGVAYVGIEGDFVRSHTRWQVTETWRMPIQRVSTGSWQRGYVEGRSAGSLNVRTVSDYIDSELVKGQVPDHARIFEGEVRAGVIVGEYQTEAPAGAGVTDVSTIWRERPALGTLLWSGNNPVIQGNYYGTESFGGSLTIADTGARLTGDFASDTVLFDYNNNAVSLVEGITAHDHWLPADWFDGETFGNVTLYSGDAVRSSYIADAEGNLVPNDGFPPIGGVLTVGEGVTLDLGDYGAFTFIGRQANIDGTILAPGGSVSLEGVWLPRLTGTSSESLADTPEDLHPGVRLGSTGVIDVAGRWSNNWLEMIDGEALTRPVVDGGSVQIVAYKITLEEGSLIDVGGGAHLASDGSLTLGDGGSITLDISQGVRPRPDGVADGELILDGTLSGYAPGKGGTLNIDTPWNLVIGENLGAQDVTADGVLEAGTAAPEDILLSEAVILPANTSYNFDLSTVVTQLTGGETLATGGTLTGISNASYVTVQQAWVIPEGMIVGMATTSPYSPSGYITGDGVTTTLPVGTRIRWFGPTSSGGTTGTSNGYLSAGFVMPQGVFRTSTGFQGLLLNTTGAELHVSAGTPLPFDITLPASYRLAKGAVLSLDVAVAAPRLVTTDFFEQGGFASFGLSGSRGIRVTSGTVIESGVNSLALTGETRTLATGADLVSAAGVAGSGVSLVHSSSLPESQRQATNVSLSTVIVSPDGGVVTGRVAVEKGTNLDQNASNRPGVVVIEPDAEIRLTAGSRLILSAATDIRIDGTLSTPGGEIRAGGYENTLRVALGENARLLAAGYEEILFTDGFEQRMVRSGGTIQLGVNGYSYDPQIAVVIDPKAVLDVSGIHGIADVASGDGLTLNPGQRTPFTPVEVDGDAGSISIGANLGVIGGDLRLGAGGENGRGGTLLIENWSDTGDITVRQSHDANVQPESNLTLIADSVNASKLDTLTLFTRWGQPGVVFDGDVSLSARRSISLTTTYVHRTATPATAVTLSSEYVFFDGITNFTDVANPVYADDPDGTLTVDAGLIDFSGWTDFGSFGVVDLRSEGDIRLIAGEKPNTTTGLSLYGGMAVAGELRFDAAQVYVAIGRIQTGRWTLGIYDRPEADPGFLVRAGKSITVASNGKETIAPLTFGERLTLRAPVITQAGTLRSPGGQLRLEASETLTLAPGSLTSVSLDGQSALYGQVSLIPSAVFTGYTGRVDVGASQSITLDGATVDVQAEAVTDVSGGGDLLGWVFEAGTGGTRNLLDPLEVTGYFAIVPSLGTSPLPLRPYSADSVSDRTRSARLPFVDDRLKVGDSIWLQDVPGLAAGYYTLLPSSYALLEGGMLVRPATAGSGQYASPLKTITRTDGSYIASGYYGVSGTSIRDPFWSSFEVLDGATWRQYSTINTYSINEAKAAEIAEAGTGVRTFADAGTLLVRAVESLNLAGTGRFGASDGLSGNLDITSARIVLGTANATVPEGYLHVDAAQIEALGAGSVLLGGLRPRTTATASYNAPLRSGIALTTVSTDVVVAEGTQFSGSELILTARDRVEIGDDARLTTDGDAVLSTGALQLAGDGALLRLSAGDRIGLDRTGVTGATGALAIGAGAVLTTQGALSLEATTGFDLAKDAVLDVVQLDLASERINLGATPEGEDGTTIGTATLERLAASADLLLRGHQSIVVFGNVVLGERDASGEALLKGITFDTALLRSDSVTGEGLNVTAEVLTLKNSGSTSAVPVSGEGVLRLDVDTLALGPGVTALGGFGELAGAAGEVRTSGRGTLNLAGDVALSAGRVTAGGGSVYTLAATGTLSLTQGAAVQVESRELGGDITLSAATVTLDTRVQANGGTIRLEATATDVTLRSQAVLDVSGVTVDFHELPKSAPGGAVLLTAAGNVSADAASLIDVSGDARGGAAGRVEVAAGGLASLGGRLLAESAEGETGGEFVLDAGTTDFAALNALLNSGRFDASRDIRLTAQDIVVQQDEVLTAHRVRLRADNGDVTVSGTIAAGGDAVNADGGVVELAGANVTLTATGRIDASAAEAAGDAFEPSSGRVTFAADEGRVVLASGSQTDLSGGRQGGGRLQVRVARSEGADLSGTVTGAREKSLVGITLLDAVTIDGATVLARLGGWSHAVPTGWDVGTGLIVRSVGDLSVEGVIDLGSVSGVGYLGLEAAGDLRVNASISDGFANASITAALGEDKSFSYGFRAGGDFVLAAGQLIRTGTGDISITAGRDTVLTDNASVIYTAGRATPTEAGFDLAGYGTAKTATTRVLGEFPTQGGDIDLSAGRDILAPVANRSVSSWLYRYGATNWNGVVTDTTISQQTSWSVVFSNYQSGIGALGGGDIRIAAGNDIRDLAVAIPTTGHLTTPVGSGPSADQLVTRGGGNLTLRAGGDLLGGFFMLGQGHAEFRAGGLIGEGALTRVVTAEVNSANPATQSRGLNPLLGLMDATARFTAGGDVTVEGVYDPTMSSQICDNIVGTCTTGTASTTGGTGSAFVSYTERTALEMVSFGGDAVYRNNGYGGTSIAHLNPDLKWQIRQVSSLNRGQSKISVAAQVLPGTVRLTSLSGNVVLSDVMGAEGTLNGYLELASAPRGTLELLAAGTLFVDNDQIVIGNTGVEYIRNALSPRDTLSVSILPPDNYSVTGNNNYRGFTPLHAGDSVPVTFIALEGAIAPSDMGSNAYSNWSLNSPKPVYIHAATDIHNSTIYTQHNDDSAISRVIADRDISYSQIAVIGEGLIWVEAGRDYIVTSKVTAIYSGGNSVSSAFQNLALPDKGSDIILLAGTAQGDAYEAFSALYFDPENRADPEFGLSHPNNAGKVVHTYEEELEAWLTGQGFAEVNADNRLSLFASLPEARRKDFIQQVLFSELRDTGIDYNDSASPRFQQYTRGYQALHSLFPATVDLQSRDNPLGGNIILNNGLVSTRSGNNITFLAPYGRIEIGSPQPDAYLNSNAVGVITARGGNLSLLANGTISLAASRTFTLQGGNLLMWTSNGDITAGVGAKTSVRSVPLAYQMDRFGQISINTFGLSTGAGIGVLDAFEGRDPDRIASRLDLLAFFGEVNAGDAGIRVVGDLNIAALRIVNASNIEVSGDAVGLPQVAAVNVGALTAATAAASSVVNEAARLADQARARPPVELPIIFTIRFLGFGED